MKRKANKLCNIQIKTNEPGNQRPVLKRMSPSAASLYLRPLKTGLSNAQTVDFILLRFTKESSRILRKFLGQNFSFVDRDGSLDRPLFLKIGALNVKWLRYHFHLTDIMLLGRRWDGNILDCEQSLFCS